MSVVVVLKCKQHPKYTAKQPPLTCAGCRLMYEMLNGGFYQSRDGALAGSHVTASPNVNGKQEA